MVGGSHAGYNVYLADLKPNVDLNSTAYLFFRLVAPADGEYSLGLRYQVKNNYQPDSVDFTGTVPYATFFINNSDVYTAKNTSKNGWIGDTEKISVKLKKGVNEVICIPLVRDIWDSFGSEKGGYANVDCLYIDGKLTADKVPVYSRINAINAQYHGCVPEAGRLMREDWQTTFGNNMTFANLTPENVDNVPYVRYTVYAETAGTYRIGVSFLAGGDNRFKGDAFIGMSVNDGAFVKVPFVLDNGNLVHMTFLNLELQEGENTILLTAALADFMYLPKYPSQDGGAVMWVDHMYMLIPDGLTGAQFDPTPKWEGDDRSNVGDSLLSVWGEIRPQDPHIPDQTDPTVPTVPPETAPAETKLPEHPDDPGNTGTLVGGILGGLAAVGAAAAGVTVLLRKKGKAKSEE